VIGGRGQIPGRIFAAIFLPVKACFFEMPFLSLVDDSRQAQLIIFIIDRKKGLFTLRMTSF